MDHEDKHNKGLRYLFQQVYEETEPTLVKANTTKLRILNALNWNLVYQPEIIGFPHDAAVHAHRLTTGNDSDQHLIYFDFLALLDEQSSQARHLGTETLESRVLWSTPAFYIILFPKAAEYVALVPHDIAWQDREYLSTDVSIPGPWLPYVLRLDQVSEALTRISKFPSGQRYVNPGTGVVLGKWTPKVEIEALSCPSLDASLEPSPTTSSLSTFAGQKRKRTESPVSSRTLAPALRNPASQPILQTAPDFEPWPLDSWKVSESFTWPSTAGLHGVLDDQLWEQYIPALDQQCNYEDALLAPRGLEYIGPGATDLSWAMRRMDAEPAQAGLALGPVAVGDASRVSAATVGGSMGQRQQMEHWAAPLSDPDITALAYQPTLLAKHVAQPFDVGQPATMIIYPTMPASAPTSILTAPSPSLPDTSGASTPEEAATPALCLLDLHHQHPWGNHLFIPTLTPDTALTHLLSPTTLSLPIMTTYTHLPTGTPTPFHRLRTPQPCLHILIHPSKPHTCHILPSRTIAAYAAFLHNMLQGTLSSSRGKHDPKRSALRGKNKRRTERPSVADVLEWCGGGTTVPRASLGLELQRWFHRERAREAGRGAVEGVRERAVVELGLVLQCQVDAVGFGEQGDGD